MRLIRSPAWQYVVQLYNAQQINPLADWPRRYSAWVVDALEALAAAMADERVRQIQNPKNAHASPGPGPPLRLMKRR